MNISRKEDTKFCFHRTFVCLFGTFKLDFTMPLEVSFAPAPFHKQRSGVVLGLPENNRFTENTPVSFPFTVKGFFIRSSTTGACGESVHQP